MKTESVTFRFVGKNPDLSVIVNVTFAKWETDDYTQTIRISRAKDGALKTIRSKGSVSPARMMRFAKSLPEYQPGLFRG